jgi:hypothetical protein
MPICIDNTHNISLYCPRQSFGQGESPTYFCDGRYVDSRLVFESEICIAGITLFNCLGW